jgi:hypothetical protein
VPLKHRAHSEDAVYSIGSRMKSRASMQGNAPLPDHPGFSFLPQGGKTFFNLAIRSGKGGMDSYQSMNDFLQRETHWHKEKQKARRGGACL